MLINTLTDIQIVEGIQTKNAKAFNYLYDRYAGAFYGEIKKTLSKEDIACETLDRSFKNIWTNIHSYHFKQSFFIWALNIVRKETSRKKMELVMSELFYCQVAPPQKHYTSLKATG